MTRPTNKRKNQRTFWVDIFFEDLMDELIRRGEFNDKSEIIRYAIREFLYKREKAIQKELLLRGEGNLGPAG